MHALFHVIRSTTGMPGKAGIAAIALAVSVFSSPLPADTPPHAAAGLPAISINNGFADLVQAVRPAVVNISATSRAKGGGVAPEFHRQIPELEEFFHRFFGQPPTPPRRGLRPRPYQRKTTAVGSGFIIDPGGLVVTNYHVIENTDEIEVVFDDGTRIPATLKGRDKKTDLALLEINTDKPLPYVKFGDSDSARVGDWVIAIGNPFGLGGTTTGGIISARGRDIKSGPLDDFIQIDAPINRGNSGGPLFNTKGEVIGINSAIYSPNGGSIGIGFAIPSAIAGNVIAQLRDSGTVRRGFLGVRIQRVSAEIAESLGMKKATGVLVSRVVADSPAEKAGIEAGDVILTYDGQEVRKLRDLSKLVALTKKSTRVDIQLWRNERRITVKTAIGSSVEEEVAQASENTADAGGIGLTVGALNRENREKYDLEKDAGGVVIIAIDPNGAAAKRGLREGDLIKRIDKRKVNSPGEVKKALKAAQKAGKTSVLLLMVREKQPRFVVVDLGS